MPDLLHVLAYDMLTKEFDPNEPRDAYGRWTTEGAAERARTKEGAFAQWRMGQSGRGDGASEKGVPKPYRRADSRASTQLVVNGERVNATRYSISKSAKNALSPHGVDTPDYFEITGPNAAKAFAAALTASKTGPYSAAVHVYSEEEYAGMRLFLNETGKAGVAVKPDGDIVSVFNTPGAVKAAAYTLIPLAVQMGGRKLDAFDTILPKLYAAVGFTVQSRMAWNDEYAPAGWSKETFKDFNHGEPDVVFMSYTPERDKPYQRGEGTLVTDYDEAVRLQTKEKKVDLTKIMKEQVVLKANPYHDVQGRFTTAQQALVGEPTHAGGFRVVDGIMRSAVGSGFISPETGADFLSAERET